MQWQIDFMMTKCKLILAALIALVCWSACGRGDILSKQQLEDILFEIHLSDGVFNTLTQNNLLYDDNNSVFRYKPIFEKYKCSRNKFEKSLREYSRKKETLDKIYANLQKRFEEMLKNYEARTLSELIKDAGNKLFTPFENGLQTVRKNFESIESFKRFVEKIMNADENFDENNSSENTETTEPTQQSKKRRPIKF